MLILTIIKALLILVGLVLTFWYLMRGITNKDSKGKSKALKIFLVTVAAIIVSSVIEFLALL